MITIRDATGTNRWCGPNAVSIVTGLATDAVARMIRERFNRRICTGTYAYELEYVFQALGYKMDMCYKGSTQKRITIARWLKLYKEQRTAGRVFLLSAGHHWQIVSGRRFACSKTGGKVVSVRDASVGRRRRIKAVYEITKA